MLSDERRAVADERPSVGEVTSRLGLMGRSGQARFLSRNWIKIQVLSITSSISASRSSAARPDPSVTGAPPARAWSHTRKSSSERILRLKTSGPRPPGLGSKNDTRPELLLRFNDSDSQRHR